MSTETLRRAAALMRERAEAVPSEGLSDWWFDSEASDLMHLRRHDREQIAHFGHPAVALAMADWLEAVADGDGKMPHRFPENAPPEVIAWQCRACGELVDDYKTPTACRVDWRPRSDAALAVARAYLGTTQ